MRPVIRPALLAALVPVLGALGARPQAAAVQPPSSNPAVSLVSRLGGKCLDVEGGSTANGARIIGYPCNAGGNQQFKFTRDGRLSTGTKCVVVQGGQGRAGDQLVLWDCNGGANEQWRLSGGRLVGQNGRCADLKGGGWGNLPFVNQPVILWDCHGGDNQTWYWGVVRRASQVTGAQIVQSGQQSTITPVSNAAGIVAAGGGNIVAAGGGNIVAAGGGNIVAAGGGNIVAAGGMN